MAKIRLNVYFDPDLFDQLEATATSRRVPMTHIVEAALASFLTPDEADQREAALVRRLDRMMRAIERFERDQEITGEALALFIRFWLSAIPPVQDDLREAAMAQGKERYTGFVENLARRLAKGSTLAKELSRNVKGDAADTAGGI
ncbi:CopG family transcriptional regulator [Rhodobacteraceae bacterium N5(2021)]|uniref:CopG family transcriptional regulator n=1 Tax=Gymnodinialimonas phycosphaerae TaxID=2841589 RepID=A0A975YED0_9RHOB|nr:CopG family transcriptional regulator [Gymnodinialimonas phycosphaerae]MBY4893512.1 CopG family transcriptional regulator [Gymnodinialimonas phycosphaerae]